ncbi:MAG: KpsF/GutQ family sugar-phosphate isomerase [Bacteroidia bacterium]|nr:KpsF/GutQ family sugar-phosphate isomerase [Bacteroidia bacterium]
MKNRTLSEIARDVLETEAQALQTLADRISPDFDRAVTLLDTCRGRILVTGMGKSGLIGRKIAATFSSTGAPAAFVHPAEALHGDLGMITAQDLVLSLSRSGETEELLRMVPYFQQLGLPHITLTGRPGSTLSRTADISLDVSVTREACPLQLAPTASTTATLAMGDALAVALMELRGFQPQAFATLHPGGNLGRRLLTHVGACMRTHDLPTLAPETPIHEVIHTISAGRLGLAVVTAGGDIAGIITDGDVRRAMERLHASFFQLQAADLMTPHPVCISPETRLPEAAGIMQQRKINSLLVSRHNRLLGVIQIYDLAI